MRILTFHNIFIFCFLLFQSSLLAAASELGAAFSSGQDFINSMYKIDMRISKTQKKEQLYLQKAKILFNGGFYQETKVINFLAKKLPSNIEDSPKFALLELANSLLLEEPSDKIAKYFEKIDATNIHHNDEYFFWGMIYKIYINRYQNLITHDELARIQGIILHEESNFLKTYHVTLRKNALFFLLKLTAKERSYLDIFNTLMSKIQQYPELITSQELDDIKYYKILLDNYTKHLPITQVLIKRHLQQDISLENYLRFQLLNIKSNGAKIPDPKKLATLMRITLLGFNSKYEIQALKEIAFLFSKHNMHIDAIRAFDAIYTKSDYNSNFKAQNHIYNEIQKLFQDPEKNESQILSFYFDFFEYVNDVTKFETYITQIAFILHKNRMYLELSKLLPQIINNALSPEHNEMMINLLIDAYLETNMEQKALRLINDAIPYNGLYGQLAKTRYLLYAKTLLKTKNYKTLHKVFGSDFNFQADQILAESYFITKKWKNFDKYAEPYLYYLKSANKPLSEDDILMILRQEISYSNQDLHSALESLLERFQPKISGKPSKLTSIIANTHKFVTTPGRYGLDGLQNPKFLTKIKRDIISDISGIIAQ